MPKLTLSFPIKLNPSMYVNTKFCRAVSDVYTKWVWVKVRKGHATWYRSKKSNHWNSCCNGRIKYHNCLKSKKLLKVWNTLVMCLSSHKKTCSKDDYTVKFHADCFCVCVASFYKGWFYVPGQCSSLTECFRTTYFQYERPCKVTMAAG